MAPDESAAEFDRSPGDSRLRGSVLDVAALIFVGVVGAVGAPSISFATPSHRFYSLIVLGCCAAMIIRRTRPKYALTIMGLLLLAHAFLVDQLTVFAAVVCMIVVYTAQSRLAPPWRWVVTLLTYVGVTGRLVTETALASVLDRPQDLLVVAAVWTTLTLAALTGVVRRGARNRYELAVERAAVLETQQATERRLVALQERTRIARDMHDILSHSLNTVAMQAEGARYALHTDRARADRALADIGRLSREAVDEVRELIDVLRSDEDRATAPRPPLLLRAVPDLMATFQRAGVVVRSRVDGDIDAVPNHVSVAAYRIIQESVTNATTHAPGAPVVVRVTIETQALEVQIVNAVSLARDHRGQYEPGNGIFGMQERVRALNGTLDIGPDPQAGGWRVLARLSWTIK